jgi:hypothetical protein
MQPFVETLQIRRAAGNMGKTAGKKQEKPTSARNFFVRGEAKNNLAIVSGPVFRRSNGRFDLRECRFKGGARRGFRE